MGKQGMGKQGMGKQGMGKQGTGKQGTANKERHNFLMVVPGRCYLYERLKRLILFYCTWLEGADTPA